MFAFPVIIVLPGESYVFHDGAIFRLNPDLGGDSKIAAYARINRIGWHEIDFGYQAYATSMADGTLYIFPGVLPKGSRSRRFRGLRGFFTRSDFENYISALLARENAFRIKAEQDLNLLVHDLRASSSSIYYQAELAKQDAQAKNFPQLYHRLDSIIATQTMLAIRTDVLDFAGTLEQRKEKTHVQIYKKIDKVVRCFRAMATTNNLQINLIGSSLSESYGPNAFEIVAYVILENAIKYSPMNSEIRVHVSEYQGNINAIFESIGPQIKPSERDKIFDKGFRSAAAKQRVRDGSGIGLYLARRIVEQFDGKLWVEVTGQPIQTSKGMARTVSFHLAVPIARVRR